LKRLAAFLLACAVFLATCGAPQIPAATATSLPSQVPEILAPTLTPESPTNTLIPATFTRASSPTPVPTSSSTLSTSTSVPLPFYLPGLLAYPVKDSSSQPFVFIFDPSVWQIGEGNWSGDATRFYPKFIHKQISDCTILINPQLGNYEYIGASSIKTLGLIEWSVTRAGLQEEVYSLARTTNAFIMIAGGVADSRCKSDQASLISNMRYDWQIWGGPVSGTWWPTPVPVPVPKTYACSSLSPRLRIGDTANVIVDTVWIRKEPRRSEETKQLLLYRDSPIRLYIDNGPICADGLTYWNIRYQTDVEYSGWVAEADASEYYLEKSAP
jgi:hypothetical protein